MFGDSARFKLMLLLVLPFAQPCVLAETTAEDIFALASRSVVTIVTFDRQREPSSLGSGVVIAPERVVTNCHVLAGGDAVGVVYRELGMEATVVDSMIAPSEYRQ